MAPRLKLLKPLCFPLSVLIRLIQDVLGDGGWRRRQRQSMVTDRQPLTDEEFLREEDVPEGDAPLWLAVRRSMAEACGLTNEALRPQDRLADLRRMQWIGPDLCDLVFRLERSLGVKISRAGIEQAFLGGWQEEEFGAFAALIVKALRGMRLSESV